MDVEAVPILQRGWNCWRIERADRVALIVDAADYFAAAKAAIRQARHMVMLIGWQFDLRIKLEPDRADAEPPDELGKFLKAVAAERPELRIHILPWDAAMLATLARQVVPFLALELVWHHRIHFRLDGDHPAGTCHHQTIIVVDDALALCGGIDMTADRWDTRENRDGNPCRVRPDGSPYEPVHDATGRGDRRRHASDPHGLRPRGVARRSRGPGPGREVPPPRAQRLGEPAGVHPWNGARRAVAFGLVFGFGGVLLAAPLTVVAFVAVKKLWVRETLGEDTEIPGEDA
jgi:hypothetical protein